MSSTLKPQRNPEGTGSKCLFCNELVPAKKNNGDHSDSSKSCAKPRQGIFRCDNDESLQTQLDVFFMLRKILGFRVEFLETLLTEVGNPSNWGIQLCRQCTRVFQEAEYLWEKIKTFLQDYAKVRGEIRDIMLSSHTEDKASTTKRKNDKKRKGACISDDIRDEYFTREQEHEDKPSSEKARHELGLPTDDKAQDVQHLLKWNERGIPYLTLADFELKIVKKVEDIVETVAKKPTSTCLKCSKDFKSESSNPAPRSRASSTRTNSVTEEMEIDQKANQSSVKVMPPSKRKRPSACVESDSEEPMIRIVNTNSLMEPEEDNDAVPQLLAVFKRDITENFEGESDEDRDLEDPLANDKDDPDYDPETSSSNILGKSTKDTKSVENGPSKFLSLKIKPIKKGPRKFGCSKCSATFDNRRGCQTHIIRDHYDDREPFHCHICSAKFTLPIPLTEHVLKAHGGVKTPYDDDFDPEADKSGSQNSDKINEGSEAKKQKGVVSTSYTCPHPKCSERFSYKRAMQKHAKNAHGAHYSANSAMNEADSSDLKCEICAGRNIVFRALTQDILDIHTKRIHGTKILKRVKSRIVPKTKPEQKAKPTTMKCPDCGKMFANSTAMVEHLKNPQHKCDLCHTHFMLDMELKRHQELDHASAKPYQCPFCSKAFSSQIVYEKHVENHQSYDVHQCEICQVKITGLNSLTQHMETHSNSEFQQQLAPNPGIFGI